jgi:hypothetical protein
MKRSACIRRFTACLCVMLSLFLALGRAATAAVSPAERPGASAGQPMSRGEYAALSAREDAALAEIPCGAGGGGINGTLILIGLLAVVFLLVMGEYESDTSELEEAGTRVNSNQDKGDDD